jgi:NACHT domain
MSAVPLDPLTMATAANLLSDAIAFVSKNIATRSAKARHNTSDERAATALREGGQRLAQDLNTAIAAQNILPLPCYPLLREFLKSGAMASIARQLCAAVFVNQISRYKNTITSELTTILALEIHTDDLVAADVASLIADKLIIAFEAMKRSSHDKDLQTDGWRQLVVAHLSSLDRALDFLGGTRFADIDEIRRFSVNLREQVRQRHRLITPPNLGGVRRVPIDSIYVLPRLKASPHKRNYRPALIDSNTDDYAGPSSMLQEVIETAHRTVILGNPGTGKTTLVTKLCYELAGRSKNITVAGRHPVPIPIVLRDFASARKEGGISVRDYIIQYIHGSLQLEMPPKALDYLLLTGGTMIVFDGLDELLDTSFRQAVVADVESFCNRYPATPILVTSRLIGYDEAPLDDSIFHRWELAGFDGSDVKSYVTKWFALTSELSPEDLSRTVAAFMHESDNITDLRSNPLMLALLCNIYRGEHYLPRYRTDVYERCAIMLFERWDRSRGITVPMSFEASMSTALMAIAYWIYASENAQSGVTEKSLIDQVTSYLHLRRYQYIDEARLAAIEFVQYCRSRAWVLTETGTTADGQPLYQFAHRTFLEYFAAAHLVRVHITPQQLWRALRKRVAHEEWEMVASLAIQLIHRNVEDGGDIVFKQLVADSAKYAANYRWNLLFFAVRCLEFLAVSPKTVARIVNAVLTDAVLTDSLRLRSDSYDYDTLARPLNTLSWLYEDSADENVDAIIDELSISAYSVLPPSSDSSPELPPLLLLYLVILTECAMARGRLSVWSEVWNYCKAIYGNNELQALLGSAIKLFQGYFMGLVTPEQFYSEMVQLSVDFSNGRRLDEA